MNKPLHILYQDVVPCDQNFLFCHRNNRPWLRWESWRNLLFRGALSEKRRKNRRLVLNFCDFRVYGAYNTALHGVWHRYGYPITWNRQWGLEQKVLLRFTFTERSFLQSYLSYRSLGTDLASNWGLPLMSSLPLRLLRKRLFTPVNSWYRLYFVCGNRWAQYLFLLFWDNSCVCWYRTL